MKKKDSSKLLYSYLLMILIFSIVVLCLFISNEIKANNSWEEFSAYLEEDLPLLMENYNIPGANIAIIENGEVKIIKSYGFANIEQELSMTVDKIFRADSITKMFTAWGVINLVEKGKLDLDAPAEKYLRRWNFPETEFDENKITVRMLLSHSAGLPFGVYDGYNALAEEIPSLEESLSGKAGAPEAKPVQEPGQSFVYSNPGFAVLELIIEEVTGYDYAYYMEKEILSPLGMNNSGFLLTNEIKSNTVTNYNMGREAIPFSNIEAVKAHGGLYTTIEDLSKFTAAWMKNIENREPGGKILKPESIDKVHNQEVETTGMYKFFSDSYGLGHFIKNIANNQQVIFHGGEGSGSGSIAAGIPEMGAGIIILTNSNGSWQFLAAVLDHWIDYLGIEWQGISYIFQVAEIVAKVILTIILFLSVFMIWKIIRGFVSGQRHFKPLAKKSRILRFFQFIIAVLILLIWWGTSIKELLVWLLPNLSLCLEAALIIFSLLLILLSIFTKESKKSKLNT